MSILLVPGSALPCWLLSLCCFSPRLGISFRIKKLRCKNSMIRSAASPPDPRHHTRQPRRLRRTLGDSQRAAAPEYLIVRWRGREHNAQRRRFANFCLGETWRLDYYYLCSEVVGADSRVSCHSEVWSVSGRRDQNLLWQITTRE
jgi:hypothetical protein